MSLKVSLKPNEKMIVSGAALRNGITPSTLLIENNAPILREKDIINEKDADSPARRIYFVIQIMYLDQENLKAYHAVYWDLVRAFVQAVPSALRLIDEMSNQILCAHYYKALKAARKLIDYEQSILSKA